MKKKQIKWDRIKCYYPLCSKTREEKFQRIFLLWFAIFHATKEKSITVLFLLFLASNKKAFHSSLCFKSDFGHYNNDTHCFEIKR